VATANDPVTRERIRQERVRLARQLRRMADELEALDAEVVEGTQNPPEISNPASQPEGGDVPETDIRLEAWVELPQPKPTLFVKARPGQPSWPDPPVLEEDDQ
jgi:hypothetical protein